MKVSGTVTTIGDDIDTDIIFPARYLAILDPKEQAKYLFEPLGAAFRDQVCAGGVLAAGWNFGCGSSREHAVTSLIGAGVKLVVAKSFSRIFFRNSINTGLPVIVSPELADAVVDGVPVEVDLAAGGAKLGDRLIAFTSLSPELLAILTAGGLWAAHEQKMGGNHAAHAG
ncbi:MAG: 3-isopropylmalate dehydratase [Alphaproteobacteria bacterium]|nr:3-isopropylmalate dehydratase [Alphaproteobacteria bacterium]MBU0796125.1 3-isopropylmalate dehydratase [Alphaproteobacteria bacterium]MBU0888496.1 3-isopropylmalate dehydratase [Alphaproteobacteria bacterium]MBU1813041.1 3-isopropylmalate dehydratase [Alphaproteobacteria bacterium]MBU2091789.1 3-isopropylmalate dehydratase [Alphaproteobacteria bacterium]